jgi:hypothetical protein
LVASVRSQAAIWNCDKSATLRHAGGLPDLDSLVITGRETLLETFIDEDKGFQSWLSRHWRGYVVNCHRRPSPDYLVLHIADCGSLTRHGNYTTKDYIKVCSDSRWELDRWARDEVRGSLQRCGECNP